MIFDELFFIIFFRGKSCDRSEICQTKETENRNVTTVRET